MEFCLRAVGICDEFWLFGISDGTLQELCHAQKLGKLIRVHLNEFDPNWLVVYRRLALKYNFPLRDLFEQGLVGGQPPEPL